MANLSAHQTSQNCTFQPEAGWLTDHQYIMLIERLVSCSRRIRCDLAARLSNLGLTEGEFFVLWACRLAPAEGVSQNELAVRIGVSAAQISSLVERLRATGYLEGRRDPADRRRQCWRLTTAGEDCLRTALASLADWTAQLKQRLDEPAAETLHGLLARLEAPPPAAPATTDCSVRQALQRTAACLCIISTLVASIGCTRAHYRRQADREVYGLIDRASEAAQLPLSDYSIEPDPASRFYDPHPADRPPMPPDDPVAHRLMHCVDCKRGWPCWHRNGSTAQVENPAWKACLPLGEDGVVILDRQGAVRLALLHSREYQRAMEELYLSALDVTFQRFRFDAQFFGGHSTFFTTDGPLYPYTTAPGQGGNSSSQLALHRDAPRGSLLELRKLTATGGELVVGAANSLVWQFAGPDQYTAFSILDFSFMQPLLRAGGRAVVLENLTQAERNLLANIRQMERFRQAFFVQVVAGRSPAPNPSRGGLAIDSLGPLPPGTTGGLLALLGAQVQIRNQRANVAGLRKSLDELQEHFLAGRTDSLQVDIARQALYSAQNRLLALQTSYQDRLDAFKITLGLPPDLDVRVEDPLMEQLELIDRRTVAAQEAVEDVLQQLQAPNRPQNPQQYAAPVRAIRQQSADVLALLLDDLQKLEQVLPERKQQLELLAERSEVKMQDVDRRSVDPELLQALFEDLQAKIRGTQQQPDEAVPRPGSALQQPQERSEDEAADQPPAPPEPPEPPGAAAAQQPPKLLKAPESAEERFRQGAAGQMRRWLAVLEATQQELQTPKQRTAEQIEQLLEDLRLSLQGLSETLFYISLLQAEVRVETITLVPIDLEPDEALDIARQQRLDWINARAALVDQWRQIQLAANALRSNVDVVLSGQLGTEGNDPWRFRSTTGRLRAGVQLDAPLTRLAERNLYREALIQYQRARRSYYALEDRISQGLRLTLRSIRQSQLDFELRRMGVHVACRQVDFTRERLKRPLRPGQAFEVGTSNPTLARDLVQAYSGLLNAQDAILNAYLDYEADRLNLDLDLGTMRLDSRGMWLDPGPVRSQKTKLALPRYEETPPPEEIPPPEPSAEPPELPLP